MKPKTLFEKIWEAHVVIEEPGKPSLIYIDRHLVHEVTSPQAFEGLRLAGRKVRRADLTFATMDHNARHGEDRSKILFRPSRLKHLQSIAILVPCITNSPEQGIVHVIGPELRLTLPGLTWFVE
jgi:3-isopropylmalate/(R)-2-methylmalate dehydratase large subunit